MSTSKIPGKAKLSGLTEGGKTAEIFYKTAEGERITRKMGVDIFRDIASGHNRQLADELRVESGVTLKLAREVSHLAARGSKPTAPGLRG